MSTITASEARANLYRLIDEAAESHKPIACESRSRTPWPNLLLKAKRH